MKRGELSIRSNHVTEETISFESTSSDSESSSPKPLWPSDDIYKRLMIAASNDSTASKSLPSLDAKDSASSSLTFFQKLFLELLSSSHQAPSNICISIISDNPATHSTSANGSKPKNSIPSLPPLDEYHPLDDFLPSLIKEKDTMSMQIQAISVVSDNPSSSVTSVDSSSEQSLSLYSITNEASENAAAQCDSFHHACGGKMPDEEKVLNCIAMLQVEELKTKSDDRFADYLSEMDESREHSRVGRSNSLDVIYSIPRPDCKNKRPLSRALSFEEGKKRPSKYDNEFGNLKKVSSKSPLSVIDLFNPEDTAELRSTFHSLV